MNTKLTVTIANWIDRIFVWPVLLYRFYWYGAIFRKIDLGEGYFTIVETSDYYKIRQYKWCIWGTGVKFYAVRIMIVRPGKTKLMYLQREIMKAPKGLVVDHRNLIPLDNRRANLRLATRSENMQNRRKTGKKTRSKYIGVMFDKRSGKWYGRIKCRGRQVRVGSYENEIEAARARDEAAKKYFGEFAMLNFPEKKEDERIKELFNKQECKRTTGIKRRKGH